MLDMNVLTSPSNPHIYKVILFFSTQNPSSLSENIVSYIYLIKYDNQIYQFSVVVGDIISYYLVNIVVCLI